MPTTLPNNPGGLQVIMNGAAPNGCAIKPTRHGTYTLICPEGRIHVVIGGDLPNILVQCKQYLSDPASCKVKVDRIIAAGSGAPAGPPPPAPPPQP